nr:mucin-5AC-like [Nerophis lumbriciformis]
MSGPPEWIAVWVWVTLVTLARLGQTHTGTNGDVHGCPDAGFFPAPVWKFLAVSGRAGGALDLGRPRFRCGDTTLSVRVSLIRHSKARLPDGRRLLALHDACAASVRSFGPWLLLKLPYSSCHLHATVSNGRHFHQLEVHYFDSLLQTNIIGVASCENPATAVKLTPPLVLCSPTQIIVKVPMGTKLIRVKDLGNDGDIRTTISTSNAGAVFVQISTPANMSSIMEMILLDSLGDMSTMLAACNNATTQSGRTRQPRSVQQLHMHERGGVEARNVETYNPETQACATPVTRVSHDDAHIFELWGYDEIPQRPYTVDNTGDTTCDQMPASLTPTPLGKIDTSPEVACAATTSTASTSLFTGTCSPPASTHTTTTNLCQILPAITPVALCPSAAMASTSVALSSCATHDVPSIQYFDWPTYESSNWPTSESRTTPPEKNSPVVPSTKSSNWPTPHQSTAATTSPVLQSSKSSNWSTPTELTTTPSETTNPDIPSTKSSNWQTPLESTTTTPEITSPDAPRTKTSNWPITPESTATTPDTSTFVRSPNTLVTPSQTAQPSKMTSHEIQSTKSSNWPTATTPDTKTTTQPEKSSSDVPSPTTPIVTTTSQPTNMMPAITSHEKLQHNQKQPVLMYQALNLLKSQHLN